MIRGFGVRPALAAVLIAALMLGACKKEDQTKVDEKIDKLGQDAKETWKQAEPQIKEGLHDAGQAVGKGVEAAGELIQKGGEKLQDESRDTSRSTLPDTISVRP